MQRPPPLQLLPAFEAAARLLSFSKAAVELHVTTAAVSQQIKQLEKHLGLPLFRRLTRRVELTDAGQAFAVVATQTMSAYRQGHADLMHRHSRPVLRMSTSPFVAHELLIPRLAAFQAEHPDIDLRLEATMALADFTHDTVDAAIRFGGGQWPGLEAHLLCHCQATIVASPELAKRLPVRQLADLRQHVLIHPRHTHMDWDAFAKSAKLPAIERQGDLMLDSDLAALRAAEQGLGVAFCIAPATARGFHSDRLMALMPPFDLPIQAYFVFQPQSAKRALLLKVCDWIRTHVAQA